MNYQSRIRIVFGLAALLLCWLTSFGALVASAADQPPVVTVLPVFREGVVTPTRLTLATDLTGSIYVSDPHGEGILKFDRVGNLSQRIVTAKEPIGIAIDQNGRLLVTQENYLVALNADGSEFQRFGVGSFSRAYSIAVDLAGTGEIYVSDIQSGSVQVFNKNYTFKTTIGAGLFNRPAGVAFEKIAKFIYVTDSLNGQVKAFDQAGVLQTTIGTSVGYNFQPIAVDKLGIQFTYPQAIAFEYFPVAQGGALRRMYVLDTFQGYVSVVDMTVIPPERLSEIGKYGHSNGDLVDPSDLMVDTFDADNNRLIVANGFGSLSVYGLGSLQVSNVNVTNIQTASLQVNWTVSASPYSKIRVYRSTTEKGALTQVGSDILYGGNPFVVDTGLLPYTTYYYTIRVVDLGNVESQNTSQVSAKTTGLFNLTINNSGNGQVSGSVSCSGASCVSSQSSDSILTLTAVASGTSVLSGWTGDCLTTSPTCIVTMDNNKFVTAIFTAMKPFLVDGAYYDSLQLAYNAASDGSVIKVMTGTWPATTSPTEYMTAWQAKSVSIEGGYNATFLDNVGNSSTVVGRTNLSGGKVVMKQFRLK